MDFFDKLKLIYEEETDQETLLKIYEEDKDDHDLMYPMSQREDIPLQIAEDFLNSNRFMEELASYCSHLSILEKIFCKDAELDYELSVNKSVTEEMIMKLYEKYSDDFKNPQSPNHSAAVSVLHGFFLWSGNSKKIPFHIMQDFWGYCSYNERLRITRQYCISDEFIALVRDTPYYKELYRNSTCPEWLIQEGIDSHPDIVSENYILTESDIVNLYEKTKQMDEKSAHLIRQDLVFSDKVPVNILLELVADKTIDVSHVVVDDDLDKSVLNYIIDNRKEEHTLHWLAALNRVDDSFVESYVFDDVNDIKLRLDLLSGWLTKESLDEEQIMRCMEFLLEKKNSSLISGDFVEETIENICYDNKVSIERRVFLAREAGIKIPMPKYYEHLSSDLKKFIIQNIDVYKS